MKSVQFIFTRYYVAFMHTCHLTCDSFLIFFLESMQFIYNWYFGAFIPSICLLGMFSALRLAVQAFKREEDSAKSLKRRRDRLELV